MSNSTIDVLSIHGETTYVELQDQYGLYQNITPYGLSTEEAVNAQMLSTATMGTFVQAYQPGLSDGTAKFGAHWHATLDGIIDALVAKKASTKMRIYPNGHGWINSGVRVCTMNVVLSNLARDTAPDAQPGLSFDMEISNSLPTWTTL